MICSLSENFKIVISRACSMLNETGRTDVSAILMFFASIDYSDLKAAQLKTTNYLTRLANKNEVSKKADIREKLDAFDAGCKVSRSKTFLLE